MSGTIGCIVDRPNWILFIPMIKAREPKLFEQVLERKFGWSTCFLCGCRLDNKNRSDEHVFPKWLQRKYKLVDERLRLPNGTTVPYRQLTIPCCRVCNTKHLHPVEKIMSQAAVGGPRAVRALDPWYIFIWLGKMFYGILYRELFLLWDRARGNKGTITTKEILREYRMHHLFLQSVRVPMQFVGCFPHPSLSLRRKNRKIRSLHGTIAMILSQCSSDVEWELSD